MINRDLIKSNVKILTNTREEKTDYFINKAELIVSEKIKELLNEHTELIEELVLYLLDCNKMNGIKAENMDGYSITYGTLEKSNRLNYLLNKYEIDIATDNTDGEFNEVLAW